MPAVTNSNIVGYLAKRTNMLSFDSFLCLVVFFSSSWSLQKFVLSSLHLLLYSQPVSLFIGCIILLFCPFVPLFIGIHAYCFCPCHSCLSNSPAVCSLYAHFQVWVPSVCIHSSSILIIHSSFTNSRISLVGNKNARLLGGEGARQSFEVDSAVV